MIPPPRFARTGGAWRLDVDQQVQRALRPPMRDVHSKRLLVTAGHAEVRHLPVQADQAKMAFDEPTSPWSLGPVAFPWRDLPQRHAKTDIHRQAGLNGVRREKPLRKSLDPPDQVLLLEPGLFSDPPHPCKPAVAHAGQPASPPTPCQTASPPTPCQDRTRSSANHSA